MNRPEYPRLAVGLIIIAITLTGCLKKNDCPVMSSEYFPNRVGNWWIYNRFDSLSMERTSLRVEIMGDSLFKDGKNYKVWVFNKSNLYDTLFVRTTADSVLFFRYPDGFPMEVMLKPVWVGQSWTHPFFFRDSTRVLAKDTLVVNQIVFPDSYRIRRRLFAFNDYMTDDRWFVPYLGIVKLENWHYLFGWISKENWMLHDWDISK
jgi:hypothetical protein